MARVYIYLHDDFREHIDVDDYCGIDDEDKCEVPDDLLQEYIVTEKKRKEIDRKLKDIRVKKSKSS